MILFDLKLALFIVIAGLIAGIVAVWYLTGWRAARFRLSDASAWQVFEALPFGVLIVGSNGALRFSNPAARQLLGPPDDSQDDLSSELLQRLASDAAGAASSGYVTQPAQLRWWRHPLVADATLLVLIDEREQQRFIQQQQAFVGHLSHELRTPLTALLAHTDIARNPRTPEAVRLASMETIQRETQRMSRLVRDLLELYRLEVAVDFPLLATDLAIIAEEAIAQVIVRAEEAGVSLTFEANTPLPHVLAHPDRLKQVFLNLLDNAIKYCRRDDSIFVHLRADAEGVCCIVRDTGPGIPAEHLPHIAERLYRGQTDIEGSGLGLALASEILRRHNATLRIQSVAVGAETGTEISWMLPYAAPPRPTG